MDDYGIITSAKTSLTVVANDIAKALKAKGYKCSIFTHAVRPRDALRSFKAAILFIPLDPLYITPYALCAYDYLKCNIPTTVYATVEGLPKEYLIPNWLITKLSYVANSSFTADMLKRVSLRVTRVILHGVDLDAVGVAKRKAAEDKAALKSMLGAEVLFGTIASSHPRKGLNLLRAAVAAVAKRTREVGFYIISTPEGTSLFKGLRNVYAVPAFGSLSREDALAAIGCLDFYVCSSLAEGFCLPLLEANAFGIPAIYPRYAPLTEAAPPGLNLPFPYSVEEYVDLKDGILYLYHRYEPKSLVSAILKAVELYADKSAYTALSDGLKAQATKRDIVSEYSRLISDQVSDKAGD